MASKIWLFCLITVWISVSFAGEIERQTVIDHAEKYATYNWTVSEENARYDAKHCNKKGNCNSLKPGQRITGVTYNWGGFDSLDTFSHKVRSGAVAGNVHSKNGITRDFAGIDCSGFVTRVWGESPKHSTSTIQKISTPLNSWDELQPGDAVNYKGKHIRLFESFAADHKIIQVATLKGIVYTSQFHHINIQEIYHARRI